MNSLPRTAQWFLWGIYGAGLVCAAAAWLSRGALARAPLWEILLFLVIAALAGGKKIRLMKGKDDGGSMSLGFALAFASLLCLGPVGALLASVAGRLSSCLYPKRQALHQLVFNVAVGALEAWLGGQVFVHLNGGLVAGESLRTFIAVVASCIVFFLINTGTVAVVIALCTKQRLPKLWRDTFLWTVPSYFAGACVSSLAVLFGPHVGIMLLFIAPVAYLTYQSYAATMARAEEKQIHIEEMQVSQAHLADLYLSTIKSLALAIDAKDQYTHQHILRVQRYAVAIAVEMGLEGYELEGLTTGALLHDIGKLGVPEYVLLKPGRLTDEEFAKIKKHPEIGAAILGPVEFPWPVLPVVRSHHEKWDGTGYPDGLAGEDIPRTARILACADVYDALTSTRSYRKAWPHERAVAEIVERSGTHFDPEVVTAFSRVIDDVVAGIEADKEALADIDDTTDTSLAKADQAARDIQRASSELWALYEVAQTLSSSLGLAETLEILARKLAAILPGTSCLFLLREADSENLSVRAAVGVNHEYFTGGHTLNNQSQSLAVLRERKTYSGEYDSDDLLMTGVPPIPWVPLQSALIVPIVHQGDVLGTINLYHPEAGAFSADDRQLLETIAERAAMALYNGLLFDRARSHALTDPLTGLYNLRYLTHHVEERCAQDGLSGEQSLGIDANRVTRRLVLSGTGVSGTGVSGTGVSAEPNQDAGVFALLCLDLDSFKPINDNFGHDKGDQVLCDLAVLFRSIVGPSDIVARYGGDEFLILLEAAGKREAETMAERLQAAVEGLDLGLTHPRIGALRLGVSIGYACFPEDGHTCSALLSAADAQMYHDKTDRKLSLLADRTDAGMGITRRAA